MNQSISVKEYSPTVLVARDCSEKLEATSDILALFNQVYISGVDVLGIFNWAQQHQPDLIILDIDYSELVASGLISTLRLDWLTRTIPIVIISNVSHEQAIAEMLLDCDAHLVRPCSTRELETAICSLVPIPTCKTVIATS